MSRILITGGAGFIGSQLARDLVLKGNDVTIVDDFSYGKEDNLEFPDCDLRNSVICKSILDLTESDFIGHSWEYIYNIAGIAPLPDCQSEPEKAFEVNTRGLLHILDLARKYSIKSIVQASTNAIYENSRNFPTIENDYPYPSLVYPSTKFCAEQIARSYAYTYGMNVCCARFANVYGPHTDCLRKQPPFLAYVIRELHGGNSPILHGTGDQKRDYIYVGDVIRLLKKCSEKCLLFDAVNCSSGKSYSVKELYALCQKLMNTDIPAQYADDSHYWEKYPALNDVRPEILRHEIMKETLCSNAHALARYDWTPEVDMESGLKIMIDETVKMLEKQRS